MSSKCRVCLSNDASLNWNNILCNEITYEEVFYHCTQFEKTTIDQFNKICTTCQNELQLIYNFIRKAKACSLQIEPIQNERSDEFDNRLEDEFLDDNSEESQTLYDSDETELISQTKNVSNEFDEVNVDLKEETPVDELCQEEYFLENLEEKEGNEISEHICEYCGKCLSNKFTKSRHIKLMHSFSNGVLCDECPRTFKSHRSLKKHRKIHEKDRERKYACRYCEMKFFTSSNCRSHEGTHETERVKKFKCDKCEKAFFHSGALNVHMRVHTGEMHPCILCKKEYPRLIDLKQHMRSHTNDKPFRCDNCERSFASSSSLSIHLKTVHLGFKYKCYICSKCFDKLELLQQHQNEQHNTFPFVCAICNLSFVKRFFLRSHLRKAHLLKDEAELNENVIVY